MYMYMYMCTCMHIDKYRSEMLILTAITVLFLKWAGGVGGYGQVRGTE
jgi:hypothetical protein